MSNAHDVIGGGLAGDTDATLTTAAVELRTDFFYYFMTVGSRRQVGNHVGKPL